MTDPLTVEDLIAELIAAVDDEDARIELTPEQAIRFAWYLRATTWDWGEA